MLFRSPVAPEGRGGGQHRPLIRPSEPIEPATLLARAGQLLGLALNGEIEKQGAQIQHLAAADRHAIEPMPTGEAPLLQTPVTADQQFILLRLQLLLIQPGPNGWRERKAGLDPPALTAPAQQPGSLSSLGTAQQGIQRIEQDRLAGTGLAGEHSESLAEAQLQSLDQGDVLEAQTGEHGNGRERTRR